MSQLLELALHAAQLKRIPRMGWQIRGAPLGGQAENVAAHSYGVVFLTMMLVDAEEEVEKERALRMAILHDLAESLIGDLPKTVSRFIPSKLKHKAERSAIREIVGASPITSPYLAWWEEYEQGESTAARLVKDADKLDMMLQAFLYEQAGQRNLGEFWDNVTLDSFYSATARHLFAALQRRREMLYSDERESH